MHIFQIEVPMGQSLPTVFNRVIPYPTGEVSHADHGPQTALLSPVLARFMLDGKAVNGTFYAKGANKPAYTAAAYKTWKQSFMRTREAQRRNNKARRMPRRVSPRLTDWAKRRRTAATRAGGGGGPGGAALAALTESEPVAAASSSAAGATRTDADAELATQDQEAEIERLDLGDGDAADGMDTGNGLV